MSRQPNRAERRRAQLARRFGSIEAMEARNLITESLGIFTSGIGVPASAIVGRAEVNDLKQAVAPPRRPAIPADTSWPAIPTVAPASAAGRGASQPAAPAGPSIMPSAGPKASAGWVPAANAITVSRPAAPADSSKGGGVAGSSHGGSGSVSPSAIAPIPSPATGSTSSTATSAPPVVVVASNFTSSPAAGTTITHNSSATRLLGGSGSTAPKAGPGGIRFTSSPTIKLIAIDYNDGSVSTPGAEQLATPGGAVDLRAQVIDSTTGTYTYSWTTSGLTDANSISGSSSYNLTFHWNTSISTAKAESTTLTVTDPSGNQASQTLSFWVPAGSHSTTGGTTWPSSLDPGLIQMSAPAVASQNVSVVSATGASETSIGLPSNNPNVSPVSLVYNSLAANALPIIDVEHPLDPTQGAPSEVTAQLNFNGTAGTTWYYNTSSLQSGDIMQIGLQANASNLNTGRYGYTATVIDYRGSTPTTFTYSGTATIINEAQDPTYSALGAGWTASGVEKIITASGGIILDEGSGAGLWFSGSFGSGGGTYTSPAGDFSTMVLNANGTYTRTLTNGTVESFGSNGLETSIVDRNGLTTAFAYTGNQLQSMTDPFGGVTTFTYNGGGYLQSIQDPASRLTTFTMSGGDLTAVEYPDASTWNYGYDSSGRLTSVTEPSSTGEPTKIAAITYDSAERVGTITRADSTTEEFSASQEQGWTNSGTSTSPATPTLLAQVVSTYTDPVNDTTTIQPDWHGMGLADQTINAMGGVTTIDRDVNSLPTITIDPMNRIMQTAFDSKGNVTRIVNPDGSTVNYGTYNSFAEPASKTDELSRITTYTYDSNGNRTVEEDPATNVATYTYSSTQPGMLTAQTTPAPVGYSSSTLYSYQYDSADRLTTITDADGNVTVDVYNSAGQVTQVTDSNSNVTTYSYDPMNRLTGETNAAGSSIVGVSTYTYDKAGNRVTSTDPDNNTTTTTYDALDRKSTVTNPDGAVTSQVYDSAGRLSVLIDPVGNQTTFLYDSLNRLTTQVSPSVNSSSGVTSTKQYDADGEVTQTTDANGRTTTLSYDSRGDKTGDTWLNSSGSPIYLATYTYDAAKEMTGAADSNSLLTITYDQDGRVGSIATSGPGSGQPSATLSYGYDSSGDLTNISDSMSGSGYTGPGITTFAYDPALRLTTIAQSFGGTIGPQVVYSDDPGGRVTQIQRSIGTSGTSVMTTNAYDAANDLIGINNYNSSGRTHRQTLSNTIVNDDSATSYDPSGRVTTMVVSLGGSQTSTTYSYDPSGQMTGSTGSSNNSYSYDLNGNRNSTNYTTGAANELTQSPGVSYTFDNDGNTIAATTSSGTTTYTYDYNNRLTSVDQNGTVIASYIYDALGRRIGANDGGTQTWTVYNGASTDASPYADFTGSGNVSVRYLSITQDLRPGIPNVVTNPGASLSHYSALIASGMPEDQAWDQYVQAMQARQPSDAILARTSSSGTSAWYLTDQVGSVQYIEDSSGTVLDQITYDPFGNIVSQTGSSYADRFLYAGMQYDASTGLYYDHARYYDPALGRFTSQDPMGFAAGDSNIYRYVGNNPVNHTDPSGLQQGYKPGPPGGPTPNPPPRPPTTPPLPRPKPPPGSLSKTIQGPPGGSAVASAVGRIVPSALCMMMVNPGGDGGIA